MSNISESRICQNCHQSFLIEPDDFLFYEKIKVPPPTFCPECRFQRRIIFRNERELYKRNCDLCKNDFVSTFAPDKPYKVYCPKCWYSDDFNATDYNLDYDPSRPFFLQLRELFLKTPQLGRVVDYATVVNSEYTNHIGSAKNCTLVFNSDFCENVLYSSLIVHSKDTLDCYMGDYEELCYEMVDGGKNSRCFFCKSVDQCVNTSFSLNCVGCIDCFACCNLRSKNYCAFNVQYTKDEYEKILSSYNLNTYSGVLRAQKESKEFFLKHPLKSVYGIKNLNVTGDYLFQSKNAKNCWCGQFYEDCAYCQFSTLPYTRDTYDMSEWGNNVESCIDSTTIGEGANNIKYCFSVWGNVRNVEYSVMCTGAVFDCFGCNGLRKKQYCILNKQYDKETYFKLRDQIIKNMNDNPYVDNNNRIWKYGEFLPYNLSFYDYNEAFAIQHFPLTKEESIKKGFGWRDTPKSSYEITILPEELPDNINDVDDSILKEIIKCSDCDTAFKILPEELNLLRHFSLPIPRSCHNCRNTKRIRLAGSPKLHNRICDKCGKNIKTSYSPERPEIIYCEQCYQKEVY
jgi:hypothetical protein